MSDRDAFSAFFAGFIVGGLTGAIAALLFTPQSGEETRALIKDKAIELRDRGEEVYNDVRERGKSAVDAVRSKANSRLYGDSSTPAPPPPPKK